MTSANKAMPRLKKMKNNLDNEDRKILIKFKKEAGEKALPRPDKAKKEAYKIRIVFGGQPNES